MDTNHKGIMPSSNEHLVQMAYSLKSVIEHRQLSSDNVIEISDQRPVPLKCIL